MVITGFWVVPLFPKVRRYELWSWRNVRAPDTRPLLVGRCERLDSATKNHFQRMLSSMHVWVAVDDGRERPLAPWP